MSNHPLPSEWRTLRRGMRGRDVAAWQLVCGSDSDGAFGPKTEAHTVGWQAQRGLDPDGIVGPRTRAAIDGPAFVTRPPEPADPPPFAPRGVLPQIIFIAAKAGNYRARNAPIDRIIIHSAETSERPETAEALGAYFKNPKQYDNDGKLRSVSASAHYSVDSNSIVQHVRDDHCAYHVRTKGQNDRSIGIEQAGRAKQTRAEWLDAYGARMLPLVAKLCRVKCDEFVIPIQRPTIEEIRNGAPGIMGHRDIRDAYGIDIHWDPGARYPWDVLFDLIERSG